MTVFYELAMCMSQIHFFHIMLCISNFFFTEVASLAAFNVSIISSPRANGAFPYTHNLLVMFFHCYKYLPVGSC